MDSLIYSATDLAFNAHKEYILYNLYIHGLKYRFVGIIVIVYTCRITSMFGDSDYFTELAYDNLFFFRISVMPKIRRYFLNMRSTPFFGRKN